MTETLFMIYSAAAAAVTLWLLGGMAVGRMRRRRRRGRDAVLQRKYLHIVMLALFSGGEEAPRFPLLRRAGARRLLIETVGRLVAATYGLDPAPLRRIVVQYGLDGWLLRRIRFAQGYRRARYLMLLSRLPAGDGVGAEPARYTRSRNRYVRFYDLMTQLAAEPATSLRRMAEYDYPFSACEVSEIMAMLRRGLLPIAYEPLVGSPNRNLRMVGLGIVRQFGDGGPRKGAGAGPRSALHALLDALFAQAARGGGPHRLDEPRRTQGADALHGAGGLCACRAAAVVRRPGASLLRIAYTFL